MGTYVSPTRLLGSASEHLWGLALGISECPFHEVGSHAAGPGVSAPHLLPVSFCRGGLGSCRLETVATIVVSGVPTLMFLHFLNPYYFSPLSSLVANVWD